MAVKVEGMVGYFEFEQLTHHIFNLLDAGVAKFEHLTAIFAYKMVVLFVTIRLFVKCQVFAELVPFDQVATDKQIEGVIHRSPADPVTLVFHVNVQSLSVEMVVAAVDFFQNGVTFRRFTKAVLLKVGRKNLFYFLDDGFFISRIHASALVAD
jgi:hypothetical protein